MTFRRAAILNLLISVVFAALMIVLPRYIDFMDRFTVVGLLLAVWFVPFSILSTAGGPHSVTRELRCLGRRLRRSS